MKRGTGTYGGHKTYYLSGGPFDGQMRRSNTGILDIDRRNRTVIRGKSTITGVYQANGRTREFLGFPYPVMEWQG